MSNVLLEVENLSKEFRLKRKQTLSAVNQVSFKIQKQETLGVVGESGCGKTTLGRTLIKLYQPTSGKVLFDGEDIFNLKGKADRAYKKRAQIILQDPYASLNPRMTVGDIVSEGLALHGGYRGKAKTRRIQELLEMVGLNREQASRFPHEFSGGQRQRIGIARTLSVEPEFIVCDEPISALDVSIQAQIVNLLIDLQKELGLTYLFIAHDLSMVKHISDRIAVMYLGNIVELADSQELYQNPQHPYTKALLSSMPSTDILNPMRNRRIKMSKEIPSPINIQKGCRFYSRCAQGDEHCRLQDPELKTLNRKHQVACHKIIL
ncbi:ABC transporter ATP-binding protein [Isachenkonia alkalipeptolytica]|uniref:ATP-binding cassette domain-containing protein n=1 Tax=Isachenkonia alkalipeptolytica TaxID=2565777 RepID=A0AA43XJ08_9CLOT|nr:oligopeptide/dipeptide ABC transporter ATP-binding protein [Isachenkonia alkalipeptolytica]NBG87201.1 ATP-binding cassette domain-containing protein [Isachenkonia alkalipeptolytica]